MTKDPTPGRRRAYVFPGRHKRLFARFSGHEYAEVTTAAGQLGLTPTGFCAQAALDAARQPTGTAERMEHEALANLQAELFQARVTLNQLRAELSRATDASSDSHNLAPLDIATAQAADSFTSLDELISRIDRRLSRLPDREL